MADEEPSDATPERRAPAPAANAPAPTRGPEPLTKLAPATPRAMTVLGDVDGAAQASGLEAFLDPLHAQLTVGPVDRTVHLHPVVVPDRWAAAADAGDVVGRDAGTVAAIGLAGAGGRYRVVHEIGRGGMGVVYEAIDLQLERSVAIKSLTVRRDRPSQLQRFLREARIASRLNHPGIMAIHEFGQTDDGRAFMVMRLLRGETLRQILDARVGEAADLPRLLAAFLQACQAVASAHDSGVIHRDLKPANIMVGEYSLVTVMDWGLAKVLDDHRPYEPFSDEDREGFPADLHTACGTVFGTPGYLAPEQARGDVERVGRRTDVFGLGCILCEILTGAPTYRAKCPEDVWRQAVEGETAPALARLEECGGPDPVVTLARRCLAVEPEQRPADAGEIVDALVKYLESGQRRAEQQLVRFFDLSVDLFCIASLSGNLLCVNDNFVRLLGHSESVLLSRKFLDFVHPEDQEPTLFEVDRLSRGETTNRFRNRYRCADGSFVTLEWNARAVPEEGAIYAVARDVTAIHDDRSVGLLLEERDTLRLRVAALERMLLAEPTP